MLQFEFMLEALKACKANGYHTALIRSYFSLDGHHIQFNVVNAETLKDAQKHPELYSDYFNDLGEDLQNEIINRTEHEEV